MDVDCEEQLGYWGKPGVRENGGLGLWQRMREFVLLEVGWPGPVIDWMQWEKGKGYYRWFPDFLAGVTRLDEYVEIGKEHMGKVIECSGHSLISI